MTKNDTQRAVTAIYAMLDGRDPAKEANFVQICVTLDYTISVMLLVLAAFDPVHAREIFKQGIIPTVFDRLDASEKAATQVVWERTKETKQQDPEEPNDDL